VPRTFPPAVVTPTQLHQKIKATTRDTGLVRDASFRRSYLTPTKSSTEDIPTADNDDNPFLSEPIIQTATKVQTDISVTIKMGTPFGFVNSVDVINLIAVTDGNDTPCPSERAARKPGPLVIPLNTLSGMPSAPAIRKPGPSVSPLNTLSGAPSVPATQKPGPSADPLEILLGMPSAPAAQKPGPSVASLGTISGVPSARAIQNSGVSVTRLDTLLHAMSRPPGLSAALDSLGFEPAESVQIPISHIGVQFILSQISANCIIVTRPCIW